MMHKQLSKNFNSEEFDSPDMPFSGTQMNMTFINKLQKISDLLGYPLFISSGFRTQAHNKKVGGVFNSSHCRGLAADIKCKDNVKRLEIIDAALKSGIYRIGISKTFIHLDVDDTLPQGVMWLY